MHFLKSLLVPAIALLLVGNAFAANKQSKTNNCQAYAKIFKKALVDGVFDDPTNYSTDTKIEYLERIGELMRLTNASDYGYCERTKRELIQVLKEINNNNSIEANNVLKKYKDL